MNLTFTVDQDSNGTKWLVCECGTNLSYDIIIKQDENSKILLDWHIKDMHKDIQQLLDESRQERF